MHTNYIPNAKTCTWNQPPSICGECARTRHKPSLLTLFLSFNLTKRKWIRIIHILETAYLRIHVLNEVRNEYGKIGNKRNVWQIFIIATAKQLAGNKCYINQMSKKKQIHTMHTKTQTKNSTGSWVYPIIFIEGTIVLPTRYGNSLQSDLTAN